MIINISNFCIRKLNTIKQIKHSVILGVVLMNDILVFKNGNLGVQIYSNKICKQNTKDSCNTSFGI